MLVLDSKVRRRRRRRASFIRLLPHLMGVLAGSLFLCPSRSEAHSFQVEPVEVVLRPRDGYINAEFSGNIQDITQGVVVHEDERVGDHFTDSVNKRVQNYVNKDFILIQDGQTLKGVFVALHYQADMEPKKAKYAMIVHYPRPVRLPGQRETPLTISSTLFDYLPNALTMVNIGGYQRALTTGIKITIDPDDLVSNIFRNVADFWKLGIEHIFTGPDHMLFIFALLLVSPTLKSLVKTLTGFTIAHSISLVLSTLSIVTVNAKLVDILVALSIVYVGAENIFLKETKHRFWIASGFGLIHGLAFAGNLRDAGLPEGTALFWSLLAFNLGVETAQVLISAVAFPLLTIWKRSTERRAKYGGMTWRTITNVASGGVVVAGTYWLIQRAFASS